MSGTRRVVVLFQLAEAPFGVRERVKGVHRWAERHPGQWTLVHDAFAEERVGEFDGAIGPGRYPLIRAARKTGTPMVAATVHNIGERVPRVVEAYRQAGVLAGEHFIECGYSSVAFWGTTYCMASSQLERGLLYATPGLDARLAMDIRRAPRSRTRWPRYCAGLERLLDKLVPPVGILAANDVLALHAAEACAARGLRIPEDVGIVGVGNDPAVCLGAPAPLTSIDLGLEEVGYKAAVLLNRLMAGRPRLKGNVLVSPTLVARASTNRRLRGDGAVSRALDYIARRCHRPIRVADVAEAVGLSPRQLLRRVRSARRRTVAQEIRLARLRHAEELLQHTGLPLPRIAEAVGLSSDTHLIGAFTRRHGVSPAAWREGRPRPPAIGGDALALARRLLGRTRLVVDTVALCCGFGDVARFRQAFLTREGTLPGRWRQRYRAEHPDALLPAGKSQDLHVVIHYDGPWEKEEEEEVGSRQEAVGSEERR